MWHKHSQVAQVSTEMERHTFWSAKMSEIAEKIAGQSVVVHNLKHICGKVVRTHIFF